MQVFPLPDDPARRTAAWNAVAPVPSHPEGERVPHIVTKVGIEVARGKAQFVALDESFAMFHLGHRAEAREQAGHRDGGGEEAGAEARLLAREVTAGDGAAGIDVAPLAVDPDDEVIAPGPRLDTEIDERGIALARAPRIRVELAVTEIVDNAARRCRLERTGTQRNGRDKAAHPLPETTVHERQA